MFRLASGAFWKSLNDAPGDKKRNLQPAFSRAINKGIGVSSVGDLPNTFTDCISFFSKSLNSLKLPAFSKNQGDS